MSDPKRDVAPDTQLTDPRLRAGRPREVLVVGEFPISLRNELVRRGARLTISDSFAAAFDTLAERAFDVVLVNPEGVGADFVAVIKEGAVEHERTKATLYGARGDAPFLRGVRPPEEGRLRQLREKHSLTPFIVPSAAEFEVIVRLPDGRRRMMTATMPVATAVMTVTAMQFLGGNTSLA